MTPPGPKPPVTQRDLAKALGISHSTVSLALRNSPKITRARREEILAAAERMGYRPNPAAAALAHYKRSSTVTPVRAALAWLNTWPDPRKLHSYAEFHCYWKGAEAAANKFGYDLEEVVCHQLSPARLEKILYSRGISGVILPPHPERPDWGDFHWEKFSIVRIGRTYQEPKVHLVTADQANNMLMAFRETSRLGYRRIGFATGQSIQRGLTFAQGYLRAQLDVPAADRVPILVTSEDVPSKASYQMISEWAEREKPDAILTDLAYVTHLLEHQGKVVGRDIGLAVMSVLDGNADSGINQNPEEVGRVALLMLVSLLHDNDTGVPPIFRQVLVQGNWVAGSSLPPRG